MSNQPSLSWWQCLLNHRLRLMGIALLLVVVAVFYYLWSTDECFRVSPLFYPGAADGIAGAKVFAWADNNGNGIPETDEPPLPWVTVNLDYYLSLTGRSGKTSAGKFKPGCRCRCWEHETLIATVPLGYRPTTPTEVELTGQDTPYLFGFQLDDETKRPAFPGEPDWSQAFTNHGIALITFHYSGADKHLDLSLGYDDTWQSPEQLYWTVFDIMGALERKWATSIQTASLAIPELGKSIICRKAKEGWLGYYNFIPDNCHKAIADE